MEPGKDISSHVDPMEEIYMVLSGTGMMRVGDEEREVVAGDATWLPKGLPHSLVNTGKEDLVILVVASPWDEEEQG